MDIEKRVRRLERTNRLLFALLLVTVAGSAINYVKAAGSPGKIVADSVVTRSLRVVNPTGKQGVDIEVGDDGSVGLGFTNVNGKETLSLYSDPAGSSSICIEDQHTCRIVIGSVERNNCPELNIQLRNKSGNSIWMPKVINSFIPTATAQFIIDRCHLRSRGGSQ